MAVMGFFNRILGRGELEGRVNALHGRISHLVLPHCKKCGFGVMRVQVATDDPFEEKIDRGKTRMRCDRADCGTLVTIDSQDLESA